MCLHVELKDTWLATADAKGDKTWMGTNTLSPHGMMLWNIHIYIYIDMFQNTHLLIFVFCTSYIQGKKCLVPIMPVYITYIAFLCSRHDSVKAPKNDESFATSPRVL